MLDLSQSSEILQKAIIQSIHSRLPVHEGEPENIIGVVQAKDILDAYMTDNNPEMRSHVRHAPIIPDTVDASMLWRS